MKIGYGAVVVEWPTVRHRWMRRLDREHQHVIRQIHVIEGPSGWIVRPIGPVVLPDRPCTNEADALAYALHLMRDGDWYQAPASVSPTVRYGPQP